MNIDENDVQNYLDNGEISNVDIEPMIRKLWKSSLSEYTYIDNTRYSAIQCGKMLAYVDIALKNLSFGLVSKIEYNRKKKINKILLKSITYNTYWNIDIKKYHIFQSKSQSVGFFRNLINNLNFKVKDD